MAVRSLARSGVAGGKYVNFLAGNDPFDPSSDFLITETVLTTTATSVTFDVSSLASTYKHLQIRLAARSNRAATTAPIYLGINGVSTETYAFHRLYGQGSTVVSSAATSSNGDIVLMPGSSATSNEFVGSVIDILDFANANKNPVVRAFSGSAGINWVTLYSALLPTAGAITSIQLRDLNAQIIAGSRFSLYGSKG